VPYNPAASGGVFRASALPRNRQETPLPGIIFRRFRAEISRQSEAHAGAAGNMHFYSNTYGIFRVWHGSCILKAMAEPFGVLPTRL